MVILKYIKLFIKIIKLFEDFLKEHVTACYFIYWLLEDIMCWKLMCLPSLFTNKKAETQRSWITGYPEAVLHGSILIQDKQPNSTVLPLSCSSISLPSRRVLGSTNHSISPEMIWFMWLISSKQQYHKFTCILCT